MHMLAVDIGNSRIKWAIFLDGIIKENGSCDYNHDNFENQLDLFSVVISANSVIVSCVAGELLKNRFEKWANTNAYTSIEFAKTQNKQHGIVNAYLQPEKLGVDRWLAMVAAVRECDAIGDELICVIDCGTAITLDVLNASGEHQGGLIIPGYQTMIKALVQGAENIKNEKEIVFRESQMSGLGNNTADALARGSRQIIVQGISAIIGGYQKASSEKLHCFVTGGDAHWVSVALTIENIYDPFLVLKGLNLVSTKQGVK